MKYELTVVLPEKATEAKKKAYTESLEKLLKVLKGKITKKDDWGKISLSYDIKKNKEGNFLFFEIEMEKGFVGQLDQKLKLDENVIRYLIVKK